MQNYLDLHRHAAVRAALLGHPGIALRMMVAHAIGGSHLWRVSPEPQTTRNDEVRESLETCRGETLFDERRRAVLGVLGFSPEEPTVTGGNGDDYGVAGIFQSGRAACRERVWQYVWISVGAVSLKNKKK